MNSQAESPSKSLDLYIFWLAVSLVVAIPLIFSRSLLDIFRLPKVSLLWLGAGALLFTLGISWATEKRLAWPTGWVGRLLLSFSFLLSVATVVSIHPIISLFGGRQRYLGLLTYLSGIIIFYAVSIVISKQRLRTFVKWTAAPAVPVSIISILQQFGLKYPFDYSYYGSGTLLHAGSTVGNPNFLGIYLAMALPLMVGLALSSKKPVGHVSVSNYWLAKTGVSSWWIAVVLLLPALAGANSLGAWLAAIGAVVVLIIAYLSSSQNRRGAGPAIVGLSIVVLVALLLMFSRANAGASLFERLAAWQGGAAAFLKAPIIGSGPDTMRYVMPGVLPLSAHRANEVYADAHNLFLTLGASAGGPALIVFISLVVFLLSIRKKKANILLASLKAALVAYVIGHMFNPESIVPLAAFFAIGGAITGTGSNIRYVRLKTPWPGIAAAIGGAALFLWLATVTVGLWGAESNIKMADRAPTADTAWSYSLKAQESWPYYDFYALYLFDRSASFIGKNAEITKLVTTSVDKAITYNKIEADAYYARGEIYRLLAASGDSRQDNLDQAERYYKLSLKFNRYKLPANYEIAKIYLARNDKKRAEAHLDLLLKLVPPKDEHRPELVSLKKKAERL